MSDPEDTSSGAVPFRDPRVVEEGWTEQADLYALSIVLLCAAVGEQRPPLRDSTEWNPFVQSGLEKLPDDLKSGVTKALRAFPNGLPENYLEFFGLGEEAEPLTELPDEFREQWGISKGYMEFLVVDMINDGRARSRKQWVLNALRSRRISGNQTNYNSMNATVSRLFNSGVAEKHGKKIRLRNEFLESWTFFKN